MRVCKNGCEVTVFCFSRANQQARIWKSFRVFNSKVYFIYPFSRRLKRGKSLQTCGAIRILEAGLFKKSGRVRARSPRGMKLGNRRKVYLQKYWFGPH